MRTGYPARMLTFTLSRVQNIYAHLPVELEIKSVHTCTGYFMLSVFLLFLFFVAYKHFQIISETLSECQIGSDPRSPIFNQSYVLTRRDIFH